MKKIHDEFLERDRRIWSRMPDFLRTIRDDEQYKVDINLYLTDPVENYCVATVSVLYKDHDLEVETKYDAGTPPCREPERILDILEDGVDGWGGPEHFIWFNKAFIADARKS